jgi:hypothetical protein
MEVQPNICSINPHSNGIPRSSSLNGNGRNGTEIHRPRTKAEYKQLAIDWSDYFRSFADSRPKVDLGALFSPELASKLTSSIRKQIFSGFPPEEKLIENGVHASYEERGRLKVLTITREVKKTYQEASFVIGVVNGASLLTRKAYGNVQMVSGLEGWEKVLYPRSPLLWSDIVRPVPVSYSDNEKKHGILLPFKEVGSPIKRVLAPIGNVDPNASFFVAFSWSSFRLGEGCRLASFHEIENGVAKASPALKVEFFTTKDSLGFKVFSRG